MKAKKRFFNVIPQMFDIKPVNQTGEVDLEKIKKVSRVAKLKKDSSSQAISQKSFFNSGILNKEKTERSVITAYVDSKKELVEKVIKKRQEIEKKKILASIKPKKNEINWQPKEERVVIKKIFPTNKQEDHKKRLELEMALNPEKQEKVENFFGKSQNSPLGRPKVLPVFRNIAREEKLFENPVSHLKKGTLKKENSKKQEIEFDFFEREKTEDQKTKGFYASDEARIKDNQTLLVEKADFSDKSSVSHIKNCFQKYYLVRSQKRKTKTIKEFFSGWRKNIFHQPILTFATALFFLVFSFLFVKLVFSGLQAKKEIVVRGKNALGLAVQAQTDFKERNFTQGLSNLELAEKQLEEASRELERSGGDILSKIPFISAVSSGKKVLSGGEKTLQAAQIIGQAALILYSQDKIGEKDRKNISLGEVFNQVHSKVAEASRLLSEAKTDFEKVDKDDLPKEYQSYFEKTKIALDLGTELADQFEKNYQVFWQIAGFNGPKKYLFLFQNNQEMRATGGFIGSYGVLETKDGKISNLYIDDIYNPDGQLKEKVVPPQPIQKISAAWSLHDSNWFPAFPVSAEKASWFFEKTGGPTVDGVIALTPDILIKILSITGPIDMPEYDTTVDANNFIEKTQYEVEVDYDKELNRPKKFIADLAPKILDRLFSEQPEEKFLALFEALGQSLKEKHILLYSFDYNIQQLISSLGWSGEVLNSDKDYLMVVNSNINGYKTDGIIDEKISHRAEVQNDGTIIDTVKIIRKHNGGNTNFEWWNKVNADYLRVYVPKGSRLLSANGQTREFNTPPLNYDQLGFRRDPQVQAEELSMQIDQNSGTRIYEENNKTVFANWVYVSPQETVELEYQYILPFRLDFSTPEGISSYSLLVQKQSGSPGSLFSSEILFLSDKKVVWKYPDEAEILLDRVSFSADLKEDRFWAVVAKNQ